MPTVPLIEATLDDDGALLDWLNVGGVVVAATGVGHVSAAMADAISRAQFPVVVATRAGAGTTFQNTYGFTGSEADLIKRGAVMAGWLCPRKARVLLRLALGALQPIEDVFAARGSVF